MFANCSILSTFLPPGYYYFFFPRDQVRALVVKLVLILLSPDGISLILTPEGVVLFASLPSLLQIYRLADTHSATICQPPLFPRIHHLFPRLAQPTAAQVSEDHAQMLPDLSVVS